MCLVFCFKSHNFVARPGRFADPLYYWNYQKRLVTELSSRLEGNIGDDAGTLLCQRDVKACPQFSGTLRLPTPGLGALWRSVSLHSSVAVLATAATDLPHTRAANESRIRRLASQNFTHFLSLSDRQLSCTYFLKDYLCYCRAFRNIFQNFLERTHKFFAVSSKFRLGFSETVTESRYKLLTSLDKQLNDVINHFLYK